MTTATCRTDSAGSGSHRVWTPSTTSDKFSANMICETTLKATLKGLLLAALMCFALVYSQVVHAGVPAAISVSAMQDAASSSDDHGSAKAHQHASQSDDGDADHPTGKSDGNCSTHCPSVFGINGNASDFIRATMPAELIVTETHLDGVPVPADQRPPRT